MWVRANCDFWEIALARTENGKSLLFVAAKRLFKICCFTIGAPRAVLVSLLRGSLGLSKKIEATYKFFENFCESADRLEKPKSGEISDVPRLKVGDRGATAGSHTPYFQVASLCSSPHGSYIDSSDSPVVFPMINTARSETLAEAAPSYELNLVIREDQYFKFTNRL